MKKDLLSGGKLNSIISIFIAVLMTPLSAQDFGFSVDPAIQNEEIQPVWDILNLWSPSFLLNAMVRQIAGIGKLIHL